VGSKMIAVGFTLDGAKVLIGARDGVLDLPSACPPCGIADEVSVPAGAVLDPATASVDGR